MARVIEDLGHCGRASKPVGLRVYEPGSLPDPGQCAQAMTLTNESASSTAANRILTLTGADVTLTGTSSATLIYSTTSSRWILTATRD